MAILWRPLLVLFTFLAVVVLLVVLLFFGGGDEGGGGSSSAVKKATPKPAAAGTITASDLKAGDCISDANSNLGDVKTFHGVACDKPHDGEVFSLIVVHGPRGAKYPGEDRVKAKGQRGCRARLRRQATAKAFRDPLLGYKFVYPTAASWADGDREITCLATFRTPRSEKLQQR